MRFSPASCHFLPLRSKYSPHHPVPSHPQSVFWDKLFYKLSHLS
jgi:hypothetical protein